MNSMMVLGFDKEQYKKDYLDSLNEKHLYEEACENDDNMIFEDIKDFQYYLNTGLNNSTDYLWYFINA